DACLRSRVTDRRPRCSIGKFVSPAAAGGSIRITSAPRAEGIIPQNGPGPIPPSSTTRTPAGGPAGGGRRGAVRRMLALDSVAVSTSDVLILLGAFLACAVELVEALTIVLGVGVVRGWRSTLIGVAAAVAVLVVLVAALGPALQRIPIQGLRLVVGAL